jgi:VanZ family protein
MEMTNRGSGQTSMEHTALTVESIREAHSRQRPGARTPSRQTWLIAAAACALIFTILSLFPIPTLASMLPKGFDPEPIFRLFPLFHYTGYMCLTLILFQCFPGGRPWTTIIPLVAPLALGGIVEILQQYVPGHSMSLEDFGVDLLGVMTGFLLYYVTMRFICPPTRT